MIIQRHDQDINTPTGLMRCTVYRPQAEGRFPCVFFYSEIFQQTLLAQICLILGTVASGRCTACFHQKRILRPSDRCWDIASRQ